MQYLTWGKSNEIRTKQLELALAISEFLLESTQGIRFMLVITIVTIRERKHFKIQ